MSVRGPEEAPGVRLRVLKTAPRMASAGTTECANVILALEVMDVKRNVEAIAASACVRLQEYANVCPGIMARTVILLRDLVLLTWK